MFSALEVFGIVSIATAVSGIIMAIGAARKEQTGARYMSLVCLMLALVDLFYLFSIMPLSYRLVSLFSSLYFISIDFMLFFLLQYIFRFTGHTEKNDQLRRITSGILQCWIVVDVIVLIVNVFKEIALTYIYRGTTFAQYRYDRFFLYNCHLVLSYVMVVMVVVLLVHKLFHVPHEYQFQYAFVIIGILVIVLINAAFLYIPKENVWTLIDWSIMGYAIAAYVLYWTSFQYATHGMLNRLKNVIFENIDQGLVLFDYTDHLILANARARSLVKNVDFDHWLAMDQLLSKLNLSIGKEERDRERSLQCESDGEFLRCDYSTMKNSRGQSLGHLFIFTNASLETDLLTGFQNKENFDQMVKQNPQIFPVPSAVAIFDIDNLGVINSRFGKTEGDRRIRDLSQKMREAFPGDSYFVRGTDAHLVAIVYHETEKSIKEYIRILMHGGTDAQQSGAQTDSEYESERNSLQGIEYAVAQTSKEHPQIETAIEHAGKALRNKKLLNGKSGHSELIASLEQALEQCDPDTRAHVERTRTYGRLLGEKVGLTDMEQTQLSLLCLLHDIGKIGIPLEILNKPGKLDPQEWKVMQSHVEKGYEIAKSSKEISDIADMILHHHERWDGKGYPDGLDKESIPLLSRFIGVVDAFDAMTHDRVYRKAIPVSEAVAELKRCAGTQFDPTLVSAFVKVIEENHITGQADERTEQSSTQSTGSNILNTEDGQHAGNERERRQTALGAVFGPEQRTASDAASAGNNHTVSSDGRTTDWIHDIPYTELVLDDHLNVLSVDENFMRITGYSKDEIHYVLDLIPEDDRTSWLMHYNQQMAGREVYVLEFYLQRGDGSRSYVACTARRHFNAALKENRTIMLLIDSEASYARRKMEAEEQDKAIVRLRRWEDRYRRDSLTGILTHDAFVNDVEQHLLQKNERVILLMVDVDRFKQFNDSQGHHRGDEFLIAVANSIQNSIRKSDLSGRLGGDEFAAALILRRNETDDQIRQTAQTVYERINAELSKFAEGTSISMGAAVSSQERNSFVKLYEEADRQLYNSKNEGRARLSIGIIS